MGILQLLLLILVVGVCVGLVNKFIPMEPPYKQLFNIVVMIFMVVVVIVWLLNFFHVGGVGPLRLWG